jgi:hypothetical protein
MSPPDMELPECNCEGPAKIGPNWHAPYCAREIAKNVGGWDVLTTELRWILGRPNFTCASFAQCLRIDGATIETRAEDEQAATIHWMLKFYLLYGAEWRKHAEADMQAMRLRASEAGKLTPSGEVVG